MQRFIIIIATVIRTPGDLKSISATLAKYLSAKNWTIDLQDSDNVLRLCCSENIAPQIVEGLHRYGISSTIMGVFEN